MMTRFFFTVEEHAASGEENNKMLHLFKDLPGAPDGEAMFKRVEENLLKHLRLTQPTISALHIFDYKVIA